MYKHAISLTCPNADTTVKDLATLQSSCPSVTPGIGGNYFSIASEERLGIAQTTQFQSGVQTGADWVWASKKNESGAMLDVNNLVNVGSESSPKWIPNNATRNDWIRPLTGNTSTNTPGRIWTEDNARVMMPRGYKKSNGNTVVYNFYAATAESLQSVDTYHLASDSVCPKGWKVPGDNQYANLFSALNLIQYDASSAKKAYKIPLSIVNDGLYYYDGYSGSNGTTNGFLWTSASSTGLGAWRVYYDPSQIIVAGQSNTNRSYGQSVRCIKE